MRPSAFDPARVFLIFAPILYLAYALLTPPFQTPDEHQHLFRAYQLASGQLIGDRSGNESGGDLPASLSRAAHMEIGNTAPHVSRPLTKATLTDRFTRATPLKAGEPLQFTNFLGAVTYAPVGYLPQIVAVGIGRALDLSVEAILRIGRVLNIGLAIALFYAAFRVLPVGRMLLLFTTLLPMTAACVGSFGQDGLVIAASALLTALSLRAVMLRRWTWKEAITAAAMTSVITLAKVVYVPLAGLALLPRGRSNKFWQRALPPVVFGTIALLLTALWFKAVSGLLVPMVPGMPTPAEQLGYLLEHPLTFPKAMVETYVTESLRLIEMLFLFGWLNVGPVMPAASPAFAGLVIAIWHGDERAERLPPLWRVWAIAVCFGVIVLLTLALYVMATPLGATFVSGLQGRYFIPIALPLLLPLLRQREDDGRFAIVTLVVLSVMSNINVLMAVYRAFYV